MSILLYRFSQRCFGVLFRLVWGFRAGGQEHVPAAGPVLIVANHASYLDPALLGLGVNRPCRFLARASLGRIPLVGSWMRGIGTLFVDRDAPTAAVFHRLIEVLEEGDAACMFPEGTRSGDGRVGPFKRGVQLLAKKTGASVVPAGIRGSFAAFPRGRCVPRPFRRCSVVYGPPMTAAEVLAEDGLEELRRRVARLCGQPLATDVATASTTAASSAGSGANDRS
ncbi:MAG: lysophospholipid acyltransferase family protein [Planctomycetota bacterium]